MRIGGILLGLVAAVAAVLGAAVVAGGDAPAQVAPHPELPSLLVGVDGAARVAPVFALGAVFGALQIAFFGACFLLGMRGRRPLPGLRTAAIGALIVYEGVFAALLWLYRGFLGDPGGALVLGFPAPTAVMLYALWPLPLLFLWIYLHYFDRWAPDEAEIARLRGLATGREREG